MQRSARASVLFCTSAWAADYSFVQVSDTQIGLVSLDHDTRTWRAAVEQINALDVDFVIVTGDMVQVWNNQSQINAFRDIASGIAVPYYVVPGNHDVGPPPQFTPTPHTMAQYRRNYGPDYYAMWRGNDRLIVVNTNYWRSEVPIETIAHDTWLVAELAAASLTADRILVFGHHPLYAEHADEPFDTRNLPPDKRAQILSWFQQYHVDAYITGHLHRNKLFNDHGIKLITSAATSLNYAPPSTFPPLGFRVYTVSDSMSDAYEAIRSADVDFDGRVDNYDFSVFDSCASGPAAAATLLCTTTDLDGDEDVDCADFAEFQTEYTGE